MRATLPAVLLATWLVAPLLAGADEDDTWEKWQRPAVSAPGPDGGRLTELHQPELRYRDERRPWPVVKGSGPATVFVGISSYRDTRCGRTLFHAITTARRPDLLTFGVIDQAHPRDASCLDSYCQRMRDAREDPKVAVVWDLAQQAGELSGRGTADLQDCPFASRIRQQFVDYRASKGPCVARAMQQGLIEEEEFCLQVDAHSSFVPNWDVELVAEWNKCDNEYAVLSTYVNSDKNLHEDGTVEDVNGHAEVPHLCNTEWSYADKRIVRNAPAAAAWKLETPKLASLWGAGLSFSKCHAEVNVPYDPHHKQVFDGEEFARATRLWTAGYDMYTPTRNLVFHDYQGDRGHADDAGDMEDRSWGGTLEEKKDEFETAKRRLFALWKFDIDEAPDLGPYGLGMARSYEAWKNFSGVDAANHIESKGSRCGNLQWEPYKVVPPHLYTYSIMGWRRHHKDAEKAYSHLWTLSFCCCAALLGMVLFSWKVAGMLLPASSAALAPRQVHRRCMKHFSDDCKV